VGSCLPMSEALPYGAITDAFDRLTGPTGGPVLNKALSRCAAFVTPQICALIPAMSAEAHFPPTASADRTRLFAAVRDVLTALGAARRTALVVEDLHWADDATLDAMRYLTRRVGAAPLVLVATFRSHGLAPDHPLTQLLGQLLGGHVMRLALEPLSVAAVRELSGYPEAEAAEVHRITGGNPFFVTEAVAAGAGAVPTTVRDAVLGRIAGLAPPARALLRRLGNLGARVVESRFTVYRTVRRPTLFGGHWVPSYSAYTERRSEWEAYLRTTYIGLDLSATRQLGKGLPGKVGYTLEYGRTEAEPAYLCAILSRCTEEERSEVEGNLRLAILSASLQKNTLDNPIAPKSGYVIGSEVRGAGTITGSDPSQAFAKVTLDAAVFRAVTSRAVLSLRVRGGLIGGGESSSGTRLPPPQERLYAGGATSVRGYAQNELGALVYLMELGAFTVSPLGDSLIAVLKPDAQPNRRVPTGGNRLIVLNAELRLRDPFFPELLEYVPFVDAGQVWVPNAGTRNLNIKPLSVTPGLGIAYFSPIGPIQFNMGYNPNASPAGPAYFAPPVGTAGFGSGQPLVCVTPLGTPPVPFRVVDGKLAQPGTCPAAYTPQRSSIFWNRLTKTLSIGTSF